MASGTSNRGSAGRRFHELSLGLPFADWQAALSFRASRAA